MKIQSIKLQTPASKIAVFFGVAIGHILLGQLGLNLATINQNASPVWPAAGFAVGAIILFGRWALPAIYLGASFANWTAGTPLTANLIVALGSTVEAVIAASIIRWLIARNVFNKYSEFISILSAGIIAASVGATNAIINLVSWDVIPLKDAGNAWYTWWSGDLVGILMVFPLFLEVATRKDYQFKFNLQKFLIGSGITIIMISALYMVFIKGANQAYIWTLTPLFLIAGIKCGRLFPRILLILISSYVVYLTVTGYGPFEQGSINRNLLYVQSLIASYSVAVMFITPLHISQKIHFKYLLGIFSGWVSLFVAIYFITVYEQKQTSYDFKRTTRASILSLHNTARQYELLIEGAAALLRVKPDLTDKEWSKYLEFIHLKSFDDVINSMGFIRELSNSELKAYEKSNNIKTTIYDPNYATQANENFIITHSKSFTGNNSAKGWNLATEKGRREVLLRSKDNHETVISKPIKLLLGENKNRNGFLLFHPVLTSNRKFIGWSYVSAVDSVFFDRGLSQFTYVLKTKISRDGQEIFKTHKIQNKRLEKSPYYLSKKISLFGEDFKIEFYPTDLFFMRHTGYSAPLALLLNIFALFISGSLLQQLTFGQRAEELVKRRTKELELSKIQLVHSSKMASLGEMASGMAHEINNPLTIIQGKLKVLGILLEDLKINDKELFQEIDKIKFTTDRIGKIVKGLRNFSRMSVNDPYETVSLEKLIHETLDLCAERIKSEGIELTIEDIPEIHIKCRPGEISQVLINLLNNSSDAIQNKDNKWINVNFERVSSHRLNICITDSGDGIPSAIAEKIMDPFFTTKDVGKGTGLGLSISKGIIETHGGQLRMDQTSPFTKFIFDLEYSES